MEQTTLTPADDQAAVLEPAQKLFARELADGARVASVFRVREVNRRRRRSGEPFLKLKLGDASGCVEAVVWDGVEQIAAIACPGEAVLVEGAFAVDGRYGGSITVRSLRPAAEHEYDPADLLERPQVDCAQLIEDLRDLISTVQEPHLRALLDAVFADGGELFDRFCESPAAKTYHQAYRHGLLEHCLTVAQGVSAVSATFPGIDRDVAVTGALLHDIGKIEAYAVRNDAIELSDAGKLQGEIALGYHLVRSEIERIPGFPQETAQAVLHIILSHHGQLEHGSPVVPCTREATLVHMIDNLGGKLGSFDRIEKELPDGERWSSFDRALSSSAFFAAREAA